MSGTLTIKLPGAVWYDYLDPLASGMQGELGLPEPTSRKAGYGQRMTYEGVPPEVALELAEYLDSRARLLLANGDLGHAHRAAIRSAATIREQAQGAA